jgi:hypothetical protein
MIKYMLGHSYHHFVMLLAILTTILCGYWSFLLPYCAVIGHSYQHLVQLLAILTTILCCYWPLLPPSCAVIGHSYHHLVLLYCVLYGMCLSRDACAYRTSKCLTDMKSSGVESHQHRVNIFIKMVRVKLDLRAGGKGASGPVILIYCWASAGRWTLAER